MEDYTLLVPQHRRGKLAKRQRVRGHSGSFVYERPRRVRVPRSSHPEGWQSQDANVQMGAVSGIKAFQTIAIFFVLAIMIGILWFTTVQLMADPMASLPSQLGTVSVHSGDTLSSIAREAAPAADPAAMIERIQQINKLSGVAVYPGQVLVVPIGQ